MTGTNDENWFYLIMIMIEGKGGEILKEIINIEDKIKKKNIKYIINFLKRLHNNLVIITKIIKKMYEKCDPNIFYNKIRIYLSGSKNDKLPNGIKIDKTNIILKYDGGSAAQSTLIQVYDTILGIKHNDYEEKYLDNMKKYMPLKHRKYLEKIESFENIKDLIKKNSNNSKLLKNYNKCVLQLLNFRKAHMGIVKIYVINFIKNKEEIIYKTKKKNELFIKKSINAQGTGGTNINIFLGNIIKNTKKSIIEKKKLIIKKNILYLIIISLLIAIIIKYFYV
jgi:indoleamine 2,3-dioxygenase